jgi:hypothetical protein
MVADEPIVETAPSSPPELSYSKSSKSSSSSCRSLSLDNASREKLANFEDITLEETGRDSVEDCNLKPESRPTLKRPQHRNASTEKLDMPKRNAPPPLRDTTNSNARGYPSLQVAVGSSMRDQRSPVGRGMRRGFPILVQFLGHGTKLVALTFAREGFDVLSAVSGHSYTESVTRQRPIRQA